MVIVAAGAGVWALADTVKIVAVTQKAVASKAKRGKSGTSRPFGQWVGRDMLLKVYSIIINIG
jgi:hypothetical protein